MQCQPNSEINAEKGIEANYIQIYGGTCNLIGDKNVVYAYDSFSASDKCESLTIRNNKKNYSAVYSEGTISINAKKVNVNGRKDALRAYSNITLSNGKMTFTSADSDGIALHCYNGDVMIDSCEVTATGSMAIRAEKNITSRGTLKATSTNIDNPAILTDKGDIYIYGESIVHGGKSAIDCSYENYPDYGILNVEGELTASNKKAGSYCIKACSVHVINTTVNVTSTSDAIHIGGSATWNELVVKSSNLTATSSESGSTALYIGNTFKLNNSVVKATGGTAIRSLYYMDVIKSSVFARSNQEGNFAIKSPTPQYASSGKLKLIGCGIFTPENYILDSKTITIYDNENNPADYVMILPNAFDGYVNLNTYSPHPGDTLRYELSGNVKTLKENGINVSSMWLTSDDGGVNWNIVSTEDSYVVGSGDTGKLIHAIVYSQDYTATVKSDTVTVTKRACEKEVVVPELSIENEKIRVANAQTSQEYLIFSSKKNIDDFTEENWATATTYDGTGPFYLNGTTNIVNYVYTRVKETPTTLAGTNIASSEIYFGETTYVQGISLSCRQIQVIIQGGRTRILTNDLPQEGDSYYCKVGDVIQVTAAPIPADATNYSGISASNWFNNTKSGSFYADAECTTALESGKQYKTVFFVPSQARNTVDVNAELTKGYNDIAYDKLYLNVADADGHHQVDAVSSLSLTLTKGNVMDGIELKTHPTKAWIGNLNASQTAGTGTAPVITFNARDTTMTVNAADATSGTFKFDIAKAIRNGKQEMNVKVGYLEVTVTEPELSQISVMPYSITADRGSSHELIVKLTPSNATTSLTWSSSDEQVATVTPEGLVTISPDAPIGGKATITVSSGEISGQCKITVAGEAYQLWISGRQVTSLNKDDVFGDGTVSFDGLTLTLNNANIQATDADINAAIESYLDYLIISMHGVNNVECKDYDGMSLGCNTSITGDGTLNVKGGNDGIKIGFDWAPGPFTLTIDSCTVNVEGYVAGFYGSSPLGPNSIEINHSTVKATGHNRSGIYAFAGDITLNDCEFVSPVNAVIENGMVTDGESEALEIVIEPTANNHLKGDVNEDGFVNISDIVAVINHIAGIKLYDKADVDEDKSVNITDVVTIINIIAGE